MPSQPSINPFHLALLALLWSPRSSLASDELAVTSPTPPPPKLFKSFQVHVGLASGGPVLWTDTPDTRLERTTVFEYGGRVALVFGDEILNPHRVGIALGYDMVARAENRELAFVTPQVVYEIGHPLVLQLGMGWAVGTGTSGFASNYSGLHSGATLRWSFQRASRRSPASVSFGMTGRLVASAKDLERSSAFVGAQIELIFYRPAGAR